MKYISNLGSIGKYARPAVRAVKNRLLLPETECIMGVGLIATTLPLGIAYSAALDQPGVDLANPVMYAIRTLIPALLGVGFGLMIHSYSRHSIHEKEIKHTE